MRVRILGSAAGGGVPQWNCRCANCAAVRAGSGEVRARSQSSVAVSADGRAWFLLNVSPDVRRQILDCKALGPGEGTGGRGSGIAGCVLTDAELDHTCGLLLLREGASLPIYCTATVRRWLSSYFPIEPILSNFSRPTWCDLPLNSPIELGTGLRVRAFEVDRHLPRFVKEEGSSTRANEGSVIGLEVEEARTGARLVYAPCVASLGESLRTAAQSAQAVLIDGTFWADAEMIRCGMGERTATAMGHLPVGGAAGSLAWLSGLSAGHKVYVHINNTNPMLNERGLEFRQVTDQGVRVGADGDVFDL